MLDLEFIIRAAETSWGKLYWLFFSVTILCQNTIFSQVWQMDICSKHMLTRIVIWIHEADSETTYNYVYTGRHIIIMVSIFFFQTSKLHVFIKLHRNCQLLISLEQSKTPSMLINFEECGLSNTSKYKMWRVWVQCILWESVLIVQDLSSQGVLRKVHINWIFLMDIVYLSTSAYSVLCFFMKWIIIVCGLSSEVNILGYATSTSCDCWRSI